jgi:hypothetical protein
LKWYPGIELPKSFGILDEVEGEGWARLSPESPTSHVIAEIGKERPTTEALRHGEQPKIGKR